MQSEQEPPVVFISYSHDDEHHKDWVLRLATRLRENGVDAILDRWNVKLGTDLPQFMEQGLSKSKRVICICSAAYVRKANEKIGGAGYEKQIMSAATLRNQHAEWVIPVVRKNDLAVKLPTFLDGRAYIDFSDEQLYEEKYFDLLRDIHEQPILPIPDIGKNPFQNIKSFAVQSFTPAGEKYVSPAVSGSVAFDYSNNDGFYSIGQAQLLFNLRFSKASDTAIHVYSDNTNVSLAIAKNITELHTIEDGRIFDFSSRTRTAHVGQVVVFQNQNGYYAAVKIIAIKDDSRGDVQDELTFTYFIQANGSPNFTAA